MTGWESRYEGAHPRRRPAGCCWRTIDDLQARAKKILATDAGS